MKPLPVTLCLLACTISARAQTGAGVPPIAPTPQNAPIPSKNVKPVTGQDGQLLTAAGRYTAGQSILLQFVITNHAGKSVAYNFPSGQQFDITATNSAGKTVWTWSKGRAFATFISRMALLPGRRHVYTAAWQGTGNDARPLPPGPYTLSARLTSTNGPAITGSILVGTDLDPHNMGVPTRTPADNGAIRQVDVLPPVTASKTVTLTK